MKHALIFSFLLGLLFPRFAYAQPSSQIIGQDSNRRVITTAVPFLLISPDSRAAALGDAGGALSPDVNSTHWNPAKIAFIEKSMGFSLSYTPWLNTIVRDMDIAYLSGYKKITKEQAIALSIKYFNLGSMEFRDINNVLLQTVKPYEFAIDAAYSRKLSDILGIGAAFRFIYSDLAGQLSINNVTARPGISVAGDIGVYINTKQFTFLGKQANYSFTGAISNFGQKLSYSDENTKYFIPTNLRLGNAFNINVDEYHLFTLALDINKLMVPSPPKVNGDSIIDGRDPSTLTLFEGTFGSFFDAPDGISEELKELMFSVGVEYWYNKLFAARMGYFNEHKSKGNRKYLTFGLGFRYNVFGIDLAYLAPIKQNHPLERTLRFTILFNFDGNTEKTSIKDN